MDKKNCKVPKEYRESPEARAQRVREEAGRYKTRIEDPKTFYNRKRQKSEIRNERRNEE